LTTTRPAGLFVWGAVYGSSVSARDFASLPITGKNLIEVEP
jgi:hypothetical protein